MSSLVKKRWQHQPLTETLEASAQPWCSSSNNSLFITRDSRPLAELIGPQVNWPKSGQSKSQRNFGKNPEALDLGSRMRPWLGSLFWLHVVVWGGPISSPLSLPLFRANPGRTSIWQRKSSASTFCKHAFVWQCWTCSERLFIGSPEQLEAGSHRWWREIGNNLRASREERGGKRAELWVPGPFPKFV